MLTHKCVHDLQCILPRACRPLILHKGTRTLLPIFRASGELIITPLTQQLILRLCVTKVYLTAAAIVIHSSLGR